MGYHRGGGRVMTKSNSQSSKLALFMKNIFYHSRNIGQFISMYALLKVPNSLKPSLLGFKLRIIEGYMILWA